MLNVRKIIVRTVLNVVIAKNVKRNVLINHQMILLLLILFVKFVPRMTVMELIVRIVQIVKIIYAKVVKIVIVKIVINAKTVNNARINVLVE